jgi:hypothetical protein
MPTPLEYFYIYYFDRLLYLVLVTDLQVWKILALFCEIESTIFVNLTPIQKDTPIVKLFEPLSKDTFTLYLKSTDCRVPGLTLIDVSAQAEI